LGVEKRQIKRKMTQSNNILQELYELGSTLPHVNAQNIYAAPDKYFEGLASQVLNRIKALEAGNAADELSFLSSLLTSASKQTPYSIPVGYFEGLEERMMPSVRQSDHIQTTQEELENISPLLGRLKKDMPYQVPAGYFEKLNTPINQEMPAKPVIKVVTMTSRKWFRYAAAAVIVSIVASTFFLVFKRPADPVKDMANFEKTLDKEIKKTSDKELADFIEYTDAGQDVAVNAPKEEVKELLKDVPATELQNFLDEIADPEISPDKKVSME
jgi:hypothetical protein